MYTSSGETVIDYEGTTEISYPIIEYTVVGTGAVITAQGMVGSSPPDHQVGDFVDILYDPQEPLYVYMDNFWDIWMASIIAISLGSAFILMALFISAHTWTNVYDEDSENKPSNK